jgi:type II secretory pathway component GspD/PulD (secretin)
MSHQTKTFSRSTCRTDSGVKLEFTKARLDTVLDYLRESTGLWIHIRPEVALERTVDLWHDEPLSVADALAMLKQALIKKGCTLVQKGRMLNIIRSQDVKKHCIPLPYVCLQPVNP